MGFMRFWGMTHPDQVRRLKVPEYLAMRQHMIEEMTGGG